MTRTVLMNAGPWLPVPPDGYGGIENVIAALVPELRSRGIRVLLATVARSTLPADERLTSFRGGQFEVLQRPYNQVSGVAHVHLHAVVRALRERQDIDLVHDHVEVAGLAVLAAAALAPGAPPVLHTLHWDLRKHADFYSGLDAGPGYGSTACLRRSSTGPQRPCAGTRWDACTSPRRWPWGPTGGRRPRRPATPS